MRPTTLAVLLSTVVLACTAAHAEIPGNLVKIGVLSDFSGPFADQAGKGSFIAAQMAAEDFAKESKGLKAEIVFADHQNKPDIGAAIARRWVEQDNVAAVVDLPNSGVALAVNTVMKDKNRTMMASGSATSDLTGKFCQPTTVQWALDTWALGNAMGRAITERGGKSWYFVSFDYALGKALQRDTTEAVEKQGGKVLGSVSHPLGTSDFSSYLLQAQASGADVIALGDTGADAINAIKQVSEFNILGGGKTLAALFMQVADIDALGLKAAQGLLLSEPFYWDLDDRTRAFSKRFAERMGGRVPTINHAASYSATLAYLRAVEAAQTIEGDKVVQQLQSAEIDDPLFGPVTVRKDGRAVHTMFVFEVKKPEESKGKYDYYKLVQTIPADKAFRPITDGGCPLVK
ncbi:ABC transporter substrate-binding protein [Rhodopseudomonas palustris]|uniref:ABC transporter substrate-binding protein n=1 Tax=Rhodopseudomonas palustris TaxID=1076 RepID=A0A418V0Q4_RHOPL|nr:ABC transporter substrate-binding protein [Rhodopseudomonas palustris]RJF69356.1 ABC transporter substrate-binding protein [Rhodopseudomonas palustris]